MPLPVIS